MHVGVITITGSDNADPSRSLVGRRTNIGVPRRPSVGPGRVTVSWLPCGCAGGLGRLRVSCRTDGCTSPAWYQPRHRDGAELTAPGGAAMR